jgi:5-methylcytosine-specific restriction endonuclease McrA
MRREVLAKTDSHCHICGGKIDGAWDADHVLAHAQGGVHCVDNYLPAHKLCNNYRWFYGTEEFQWILKLGVWLRTLVEKEDRQALELISRFMRHGGRRHSRRKNTSVAG